MFYKYELLQPLRKISHVIYSFQDLSRKIRDYGEKTRFRKRIVSKWEVCEYFISLPQFFAYLVIFHAYILLSADFF